ncbi:4-hydroxythreonine-4-phosphate dehydrogenase PdxA [Temperatibacter marinus]|uniref:4-hydroxythreonine-4-phosphate dehydrogenase n=1 Tax=Temperatibacter marinus TaxID=1456591 RepID=A0AA52EFU9_9PROT|nr:4-hydroxythreonine-4-phosphate dehydrogenase PdxA [Temperatibacter marinus]WND02343.1 4-hydroxythreonine-4-phosphate dehydrogenase PdxA [Temperatibacter marinus]
MTPHSTLPPIVITMGDPGGVGPEILLKLWAARTELKLPPFAVIGTLEAFSILGTDTSIEQIQDLKQTSKIFSKSLPLLSIKAVTKTTLGEADPRNGAAVIEAIDVAIQACLQKEASGMVTMPINKSSLYKAGFDAPGHTEYLARQCGLEDDSSVMMLANTALRTVPVTVHQPLETVPRSLTDQLIIDRAVKTATDLRDFFGIREPRLAIAGLNPHAGEDGMMGLEDGVKIVPAVRALQEMGINAFGPLPADTLFHEEARATYDAALCMYHDQALIPVKTLDFHGSVNVTLGLPIIRTSPDHGTALDIAGQDKATIKSSLNAVRMAAEMATYALGVKDD